MISDEMVVEGFRERYARDPQFIAHAPGRVNLIGEHVDYAGGFVLPVAIDLEVRMAAAPRVDDMVTVSSAHFKNDASFQLSSFSPSNGAGGWGGYFFGVLDYFRAKGAPLTGMDVWVASDIPMGVGLSSSAAFEVASAMLFQAMAGTSLAPREIALLAQAAENGPYVGMQCGIMDQFISAMAVEDHALLIDCHSLESNAVPIDPAKARIVIINSMKKRGLVDSEYNARRRESAEGLARLRELSGTEFPTLRHVPAEVFERFAGSLESMVCKRVRHHVTENQRTLRFVEALRHGRVAEAGALLYESHASLRDDYEVSCPELDFLSAAARGIDGVLGCRMTGGGFGGCVVALVEPESTDEFLDSICDRFAKCFGVVPHHWVTMPAGEACWEQI
ncbi:MAG: galactokinase [Candidatus Sumerlaeaceae bacterium]|nr:galactokinase [Candidatus Sumerlaeaceae bacterium]